VSYALTLDWRVFGLLTVLAAVSVVSGPATRAVILDSIPPEKRTTGITAIQVVSTLPAVISPSLGGWLVLEHGLENGFRVACIYAAVIAFLSALPLFVLLKETLETRNIQEAARSPLRDGVLTLTKSSFWNLPQSLKFLMISYALVAFANGAVANYYIMYASSVVGLTAFDWGAVLSLQLLAASVIKIPGGWFSDKFGRKKAMTASLLATIPMILIFTLSQSFIQVVVTAILLVIAGIYYAPAHEALQADLTPRLMRGRVNAAWDMSSYFALGLGALVGGFAYQALGPAVPFYVFAVAELAAAFLLITRVKEPETKEA
jgi:MFS family permease